MKHATSTTLRKPIEDMASTGKARKASYFQYVDFGISPWLDRLLESKRREFVAEFIRHCRPGDNETVLDIGASGEEHPASNMLEKLLPNSNRLTALGTGEHGELEQIYPGLRYVHGDGRKLPFPSQSFDLVHSHAVIEHVGTREQQRQFLVEATRVARRTVFITTPDRGHPFEFHTGLPLLHWLPHRAYRRCYRLLGRKFYASESNLHLLRGNELLKLANEAAGHEFHFKLLGTHFIGLRSNLLLLGNRRNNG
jgi:ubiquinone/menaquinone biosynthesis C-methylase UbiE